MELQHKLDREFFNQLKESQSPAYSSIEKYMRMAEYYAEFENVLAVLSDIRNQKSYIVHGDFSRTLDIDIEKCNGRIASIWEDEIFKAIHPDDLKMKMLQELLFFHYVNRLPKNNRFNHHMLQRLRMRTRTGRYTEALHRLYYIPTPNGKAIELALCLYGAMPSALNITSTVVDTLTGRCCVLDKSEGDRILSRQEIAVLSMIDRGYGSKEIAETLNISIHTVSRHRQNIIVKLQVRNSTEACRTAHNLEII